MEPLFTRHLRNERNKHVFQNISEDNTIVWDSFLFLIVSWCKKDGHIYSFSVEFLCFNLRRLLLSHEKGHFFY